MITTHKTLNDCIHAELAQGLLYLGHCSQACKMLGHENNFLLPLLNHVSWINWTFSNHYRTNICSAKSLQMRMRKHLKTLTKPDPSLTDEV